MVATLRDFLCVCVRNIICDVLTGGNCSGYWQPGTVYNWCCVATHYGVVPKGLLTFLGNLCKEVAKTTSGTLVYRFERQTARKNSSFEKQCPRLKM